MAGDDAVDDLAAAGPGTGYTMTRRSALIAAAVATTVLALYALAGFLGVPRLVRQGVVDVFASEYATTARLESVRFNPFSFELEARGLSVDGDDGEPVLGFGRLYVDFELASLWNRAWTFGRIELQEPYGRLIHRADGSLNVVELFSRPDAVPETGAAEAGLPRLRIGSLDVARGRLDYTDRTRGEPFSTTLAPISFGLDDFRTEGAGNVFRLVSGSDTGAQFDFEGTFAVAPAASRGRLHVARVPATTIDEYLGELLPLTLRAGAIDLGLEYDVALPDSGLTAVIDVDKVAITGLETLSPGQEVPWQFPGIAVRDTHLDLVARTVSIAAIEVVDPVLPVWRTVDGIVTPGLLMATGDTTTPAAVQADTPGDAPVEARTGEDDTERAWAISVPLIEVTGARVPFEDRTLSPATSLDLLLREARIEGFAEPATGPLRVSATLEPASGGAISTTATITADRSSLAADWSVEALELAPAQPYLDTTTDLVLSAGRLAGAGRLEVEDLTGEPRLRLTGDATIDDLRSRDRSLGEDFINWKSLALRDLRYTTEPAAFTLRELVATEPYVRLILSSSGVTNIEAVLDPEAAAAKAAAIAAERAARDQPRGDEEAATAAAGPEAAAAPAAPAMTSAIGLVRIVRGRTDFADYTLEPNFAIAIEDLHGSISGLSSAADARAKVDLAGQVDRYAPAKVAGEINLLSAETFIDIAAEFRNIELTAFNPYSGKFAGYQIDKGKLSVETTYRVENNRLDANHNVVINQLQLGDKVDSPDAVSLPLKLAIALLKDSNGVIDLDLPVSGSLDDPKFRLGPIIWKVFVGLLTKIVTAPFALLGSLFGGGEDLSYLDFAAGSAALSETGMQKVETLRKALTERPALNLDIPSTADPATDGAAIVEARWSAALRAIAGEPADGAAGDAWRADREEYLKRLKLMVREQQGRKADIPKPPAPAEGEAPVDPTEHAIGILEPGLKAAVATGPAEIEALADARAEAVRDALLADGAIDPARVFVIRGDPATAESGQVRMTLSLK